MKNAIVTGGTHQDFEAMATLVINLLDVMPNLEADIVIFHDGISRKKQKQLQEIWPVKFFEYKAPINFFQMIQNPHIRYFSSVIFCKYEVLRLLNKYEKVMWTDYDVVIKENISDLFALDEGAVFVTNGNSRLEDMFFPQYLSLIHEKFSGEFELEKAAITTPLFILSRKIGDYAKYYNWCNAATKEYFKLLNLPEQAIFSMMLQKFDISYAELSNEIYALHPRYDNDNVRIVHAYGQPKFWNGYEYKRWNDYNKKWHES